MSSPPWPVQSLPLPPSPFCPLIGARDAKVRERVHALDRLQVDAAAEAAVAAVGAAERHEFLAPEAHAAAAAVAGLHLDFGFVDEFHGCGRRQKLKRGTGVPCSPFVQATASQAPARRCYFETTLT